MFHCPLASMVCGQFTVIQVIVPLCIYNISFFCGCFLFNFGFDIHRCGFTYIYSSLPASWIYKYMSFTNITKVFSHYFFKYYFCFIFPLLFFWDSNYLLAKRFCLLSLCFSSLFFLFLLYIYLRSSKLYLFSFDLCSLFFKLGTFIMTYLAFSDLVFRHLQCPIQWVFYFK